MYRDLARLLSFAFDNFNGRCVHQCREFLEKTQWLKERDLQRLQFKRLKTLLIHAYENVPYYHDLFKEMNFHPLNFRSLQDLSQFPVLTRSAMREHSERLKARNLSERKTETWLTSGTTAAPLKLCRSKHDLSWGVAAELRGFGWAGYEPGDKRGLLWIVHPDERKDFKFKLKNLLLRNVVLDITFISEKSMASFARKMHILKPQFLRGYSSSMSVFASFVSQNKGFKIRPRAIFTSAGNLLPHYRRVIEAAFDCRVHDYYASVEMSHIAAQCGMHEGLHVSEENVIVEVIKDGEPASPGEIGKIIVTNLHSYAMPFIRYDIGDMGKIYADTCACKRELSLLKPTGRTYEYFVNSDGSFTTLHDLQTIFEELPIQDFQVVQDGYNDIVIKIVPERGFAEADSEFILKHIKSHGVAKVHVQLVDSIQIEKSGKIRHVISKLPSRYDDVLRTED